MRTPPRLHVDVSGAASWRPGDLVALGEERAHYLRHVLRLPDGAAIVLFNAIEGEWEACVEHAGRRGADARLAALRRPPPDPRGIASAPRLLFAPLKRDASDLVIRMATELGAGVLSPVLTERSVARTLNLDRARAIAREAAEQSERLDLPIIDAPIGLLDLLGAWPAGRTIAAAIERADASMLGAGRIRADAVLIGPEGGFTPGELDALSARPFVHAVSLGALVLRADTAAAAALALLRAGCAGARQTHD